MPVHALTRSDPSSAFEHGHRYAPGHLGELTRLLPVEMVDEAISETRTRQKRLRDLPARVVVYLLVAACLFPEVGYTGVWRKLTAGLSHLAPVRPSASALSQARRRIGPAPVKWLFDLIRGPEGAAPARTGVWWKGLLVTAIDGTILTVADQPAVRTRYVKQAGHHGGTGYPQVRLLALLTCGTRTLIDAVFAPTTVGETTVFPGLLRSVRAGMLVLADRNFDACDVLAGIVGCDADFLIRGKSRRRLPVLARHVDGSFTSTIDSMRVRVIDAQITVTTEGGQQRCAYRLLTTLMDPVQYPAHQLVGLYHERWEIETAYLEIKASILGGRVLRARTAAGVEQEIYALLVAYQLIRTAISDATYATGMDPDRGSFTIAWQTAKDQVILARHALDDTHVELVGVIGAQVLADPLPPRRMRVCPRIVKRAISKYQARGPVIDRTCRQARLDVSIHPGEPP